MITEQQYLHQKKLAGFWTRIMAQNIDILFSILILFICYLLGINTARSVYLSFSLTLIYFIAFEASSLQATPGKLILGIIVTNKNFTRVSLIQSIIRTLSKILSLLLVFIGFSMIEFNKKRKGLHDYIANTQVIFKEKAQ